MSASRAASSAFLCFVLVLGVPLAPAWAQEAEVTLDESLVYYGDPLNFKKPATLDIELVFNEIAEYRQIVDEDISTQDARYWILIDRANTKFQERLEVVAAEEGYDLICGAIEYTDAREIPDITELVNENLD